MDRTTETSAADISVVIPARDEAANLPGLIDEVRTALEGRSFEIIIVDDGSSDETPDLLAAIGAEDHRVGTLRNAVSIGQSGALFRGAHHARGRVIATLDGDGQNNPVSLPDMIDRLITSPELGIVAGQRVGRKDTTIKRLSSRIANAVRSTILKDGTRDTGCGIKAFRRSAFVLMPYFKGMHRYLPALFAGDGWGVGHHDVIDRPRRHGQSKYGVFDRLSVGITDIFGVWWLIRRRRKGPIRLMKDADA